MNKGKKKTKHKLVFIKILPRGLLDNLFLQSWHGLNDGDIVQAIVITQEMRDRAKVARDPDPGPGYYIPGRGFCHQMLATEEITDAEYRTYIQKMEKNQGEKVKEKMDLDKYLNSVSRQLVALRMQRDKLKGQ